MLADTFQSGVDKQFIRQPEPRSEEALDDFSGLCVYLYAISGEMLNSSIRMSQNPSQEAVAEHIRQIEKLSMIVARLSRLLGMPLSGIFHRQLHDNLGKAKDLPTLD